MNYSLVSVLLISLVLISCGKRSIPVVAIDENGVQQELLVEPQAMRDTIIDSLLQTKNSYEAEAGHTMEQSSIVFGLGLESGFDTSVLDVSVKNIYEFHYQGNK